MQRKTNRSPCAFLLTALAAVSAFGGIAQVRATDTMPPELVSFEIASKLVDITDDPVWDIFTCHMVDDEAGLSQALFSSLPLPVACSPTTSRTSG